MTNLEFYKTLEAEEFSREILRHLAKVRSDCWNTELDIFDILTDEEFAFENHLKAEHGKKVKVDVYFDVLYKNGYCWRETFVTLEIPIEDYEQYVEGQGFDDLLKCGNGWARNFETEAKDLLRKSVSSPIDTCYISSVEWSEDNGGGDLMKAVLTSIQPYYVFLIIARFMGWEILQEKRIEVRKNFPKASDWNRIVRIYCSKNRKSFNRIPKQYQPFMAKLLGKVIGEFVCDKIDKQIVFHKGITRIMVQGYKEKLFALCKAAALSLDELHDYIDKDGKDLELVYGWHISDLKIYDKSRELSEFIASTPKSKFRSHGDNLTRPPQSWCYVEAI